jgi:mannose-6-phosphate isomerase-like protein (cupin superfamily)
MLARGLAVRDRLLAVAATTTDAAALPNGVGFTVTVIPIEELRRSAMSALFEGGDDAPISFFVTEFPRGRGPDLHMHPYPEVLLVETGTALFTMGEREFTVGGEHVVVVPAQTPHAFKGAGDDTLRVVSVHPSGTVIQTDV